MAVSQNSSKFTFVVNTSVVADDANQRWIVTSVAVLTVKVWKFMVTNGTNYKITVNNGSSGAGYIYNGVYYGNNKSNVEYELAKVTSYYPYSFTSRTVNISASSNGTISSGGYGPGRLSYSTRVTLPAKYSSEGSLSCESITQAQATIKLSELPSKTGYIRSITWYNGNTSKGITQIAETTPSTSFSKTITGLLPNTTYTFKAVVKAGSTTLATKTATVTTPAETGSLSLTPNTTYITATVAGMFDNPNYTRTVKFYIKERESKDYTLHASRVIQSTSGEINITGLISNEDYDVKVEICNGSTVLKSLSDNATTIKDTSLIPVGVITNIVQKLGTRELTISWNADKVIAGTTYVIECKKETESEWTTLETLASIESPIVVTSPAGNEDMQFRIKSTNISVADTTMYSAVYDFYVRDDFAWDYPKEIGDPIIITANEWNRLNEYVMAKRRQAGKALVIPIVLKGDPVTADIFNATRNAIEELTSTGVSEKASGEGISIEDIDKLRIAINTA